MAQAAIPLLVGTGVQILGAEMGWDPRLTAIASMAAGGIGAGMATGAFAGGAAAIPGTAAMAPGVATNAFNPATTGVLAGSQAGQAALASRAAQAAIPSAASFAVPGGEVGRVLPQASYYNPNPMQSPAVAAVPEIKPPFFDRTQYETVTKVGDDGKLVRTRQPVYGEDGKVMKGMSSADSLGVSMLDTFMQYELAEARKPKPRPQRSGGGGGGSGGPMAPAYNGGGGSGQKKVTWGFGGGQNSGYQPQGLV